MSSNPHLVGRILLHKALHLFQHFRIHYLSGPLETFVYLTITLGPLVIRYKLVKDVNSPVFIAVRASKNNVDGVI